MPFGEGMSTALGGGMSTAPWSNYDYGDWKVIGVKIGLEGDKFNVPQKAMNVAVSFLSLLGTDDIASMGSFFNDNVGGAWKEKGVSVFTENVTSLGKRLNQTKGSSRKFLGAQIYKGVALLSFLTEYNDLMYEEVYLKEDLGEWKVIGARVTPEIVGGN